MKGLFHLHWRYRYITYVVAWLTGLCLLAADIPDRLSYSPTALYNSFWWSAIIWIVAAIIVTILGSGEAGSKPTRAETDQLFAVWCDNYLAHWRRQNGTFGRVTLVLAFIAACIIVPFVAPATYGFGEISAEVILTTVLAVMPLAIREARYQHRQAAALATFSADLDQILVSVLSQPPAAASPATHPESRYRFDKYTDTKLAELSLHYNDPVPDEYRDR